MVKAQDFESEGPEFESRRRARPGAKVARDQSGPGGGRRREAGRAAWGKERVVEREREIGSERGKRMEGGRRERERSVRK